MLQVLHELWDFVIGGIRVLQTHFSYSSQFLARSETMYGRSR